ncbi:MAG: diguanylate cyclase [Burkholderiaceae bacterium]|nr:diguanylate cyclase [Roseateles sp.]MBV8469264.1 diguanylate cyclase [Burkholderiaceae bacterium]
MSEREFRPIARGLIRRALGWAVFCTLIFVALQAAGSYTEAQNEFHATIQHVAKINVQQLSVPVWDLDGEAIQRQINLLLESEPVGYVQVKLHTGHRYEGGDPELLQHHDALVFDIPQPDDIRRSIATLSLVADYSRLYGNFRHSMAWLLVQAVVLTGLVLLVVNTVLRRDLQAPMQRLAKFVIGLRADELAQVVDLSRRRSKHRDELDLVVEGFGILSNRVLEHIASLDRLVAERTGQLNDAIAKLKEASIKDPLTGCFNRGLFNERFLIELARTARHGRPLAIIFCDIDHFKLINDEHGHLKGDTVLAQVGDRLRMFLRDHIDWVVRFGGEEFVLVLPETPLAQACEVAERLRDEVEHRLGVLTDKGDELFVTISMGVAQWHADESMGALIQRAEDLMNQAKREGRNLVRPKPGN